MASRPRPPRLEGCTLGGMRYEVEYAVTQGTAATCSGGVAAVDAVTGERFFVSAPLDEQAREIVIENERHERFAYRIEDGAVLRR